MKHATRRSYAARIDKVVEYRVERLDQPLTLEQLAAVGHDDRRRRHAVLVHVGPYAELERPYKWLFGEWLPNGGEEAADAPVVEEYLNNPQDLPPSEWRTAICVPLR